jgi:hypothetical protein
MEDFDITKDFWKEHPQFKHLDGFRQLYATNPPKESSKLMWYLKYCYHNESIVADMNEKDKQEYVAVSILNDKDFIEENKDDVEYLTELYIKVIDTPLDRIIRTLTTKLEEKQIFIADKSYDLETFESLDKATLSFDKQYEMLEKLIAKKARQKESTKKGDEEMSDSDKGAL